MKKFCVVIEETVSEEFEVEAESKEDAILKSIQKYRNGEFILSPGNLESKKISVVDDDNDKISEWIPF